MFKIYDPDELDQALALCGVAFNANGLRFEVPDVLADRFKGPFRGQYVGGHVKHQFTLIPDPDAKNDWGVKMYAGNRRVVCVTKNHIAGLPKGFKNLSHGAPMEVRVERHAGVDLLRVYVDNKGTRAITKAEHASMLLFNSPMQHLTTLEYELQQGLQQGGQAAANLRAVPVYRAVATVAQPDANAPTGWTTAADDFLIAGEDETSTLARATQRLEQGGSKVLDLKVALVPVA